MIAKTISIVATVLLCGCVSSRTQPERHSELDSPAAFLTHLVAVGDRRFYTFDTPKSCWVERSDVPYLISRLDSTRPSAAVVLSAESNLRLDSTEADEAAFLIQGFRQGRYPPALRSEQISEIDKVEIRNWWATGGVTKLGSCPEAEN